jgi:hypothetical protein
MQAESASFVKLGIVVSVVSFLVATIISQGVPHKESGDIGNALDASATVRSLRVRLNRLDKIFSLSRMRWMDLVELKRLSLRGTKSTFKTAHQHLQLRQREPRPTWTWR